MVRMSPELAKTFIGVQPDGCLSRCPETPNCVCSQHPDDASHYMEAFSFKGSLADAQNRIRALIRSIPKAVIVDERGPYIHATFTSGFFKFVDDVEFLIKPEESRIHFRSASRLGRSDLGANKRRMQKLKEHFDRMG